MSRYGHFNTWFCRLNYLHNQQGSFGGPRHAKFGVRVLTSSSPRGLEPPNVQSRTNKEQVLTQLCRSLRVSRIDCIQSTAESQLLRHIRHFIHERIHPPRYTQTCSSLGIV